MGNASLSERPHRNGEKPRWDGSQHELWLGSRLVRRYHRLAPWQEYLLAAFEECGWPERMDDPLPRARRVSPKRRLREAVRDLNRGQQPHLLLFEVEPGGAGARWQRVNRQNK